MKITFTLQLRTKTGLNSREHYMARARRVRSERGIARMMATGKLLRTVHRFEPSDRWLVTLTRISPATRPADDDGVVGGLKGIRDGIADALGLDDGDREHIRFRYRQERGPWGVRVELETVEQFVEAA